MKWNIRGESPGFDFLHTRISILYTLFGHQGSMRERGYVPDQMVACLVALTAASTAARSAGCWAAWMDASKAVL